jgi:hypothetical protein
VVLLVAVAIAAMVAVAGLSPGLARVGEAIADRLLCVVRAARDCAPPADALQRAYGVDLAAVVAAHVPEIRFEDADFVSLPVDPRSCRDRRCADSSAPGRLGRSFHDHPATAFVHVVDCRQGTHGPSADCSGPRAGNLYLQYWLYYPDSATRPWGRRGYHRDDWESFQVRIGADGTAQTRASSHKGYNHHPDPVSDVFGDAGGWGPGAGYLWVSAGSHAGRVAGGERYFRSVPAARLRLLPLEPELRELSALEFEVAPPWLKPVWRDPEHTGT